MTNPDSSGKPTLEQLLRLKRAERPAPDFWHQFDQELRRKQLVATIEPKPWWLGLSVLSRKFAPVGLPVGAAAALALAAISYQTIGHAPVEPAAPALASVPSVQPSVKTTVVESSTTGEVASETVNVPSPLDSLTGEAQVMVAAVDSQPVVEPMPESKPDVVTVDATPVALPVAVATMLPGVGLHQPVMIGNVSEPTPSQRFIALNLAAAQKDNPDLPLLPGLSLSLERLPVESSLVSVATNEEPATELSQRNARLLAMVKSIEDSQAAVVAANIAREQAGRLNDEILYASATRLGVGGDRFSIKF